MDDIENSNPKRNHFLISVQVVYEKDNNGYIWLTNDVYLSEDTSITSKALHSIERKIINKFVVQMKLSKDKIKEIVYLNIMNLGYMTQKEFIGETDENKV